MAPIRTAIIGCGVIAEKHVLSLTELGDKATLVAICDTDLVRLARFQQQICRPHFPDVASYSSIDELLDNAEVDLVVITTSSDSHAQLSLMALRSGKHVLVEKPLALSMNEARLAAEEAKLNGKILAVSFQVRYLPQIRTLKSALEQRHFGCLAHGAITMRWNRQLSYFKERPWRESWVKGGGLFMNQCIHYIDLLQWMMGSVHSVYAQAGIFGQQIAVENAGAAILRFRSGAIGVIEASTGIYPKSLGTSISLFGDKGSAIIEGDNLDCVRLWRFEEDTQNSGMLKVANRISHTPLYEDLLSCINTGATPLVAGDTSVDTLEIVLAIYQSASSGKTVQLPLQDFDMRQHAERSH